MELHYWYLAVVVAVVALIGWGIRVAQQVTLVVLAVVLLVAGGLLFQTLILDESYVDSDLNSRLDAAGLIGVPALLGVGLAVLAARHAVRRRATGEVVKRG